MMRHQEKALLVLSNFDNTVNGFVGWLYSNWSEGDKFIVDWDTGCFALAPPGYPP